MSNERQEPTDEIITEPPDPVELPGDTPITQVEPIHWPSKATLERDEINRYVEQPFVAACELFHSKNVRTKGSSANKNDVARGYVALILDYEHMTPTNRTVADRLCAVSSLPLTDGSELLSATLIIEVDGSATIDDVSRKAVEIAEAFETQERTNPYPFTFEEANETLKLATGSVEDRGMEEIIASGFFEYDEKTGLLYDRY